jgi:hypothetical protein
MDEAFVSLDQIIVGMLAFPELKDEEAGVRLYVQRCRIESPVELSILVDPDGSVQIGSTPPLYYVDTSFRPSYHHLSFAAELIDGGQQPEPLYESSASEVARGS